MAHEIETMGYVGAEPWHKLGTKIEEVDVHNWPVFCEKSGMNWGAEKIPLFTAAGVQVTHSAVQRSTDGAILGVVGPDYTVLQNAEAFAWFQPFLEAREAKLHTAGSLRGGSRVWVLAKLNRAEMEIAAGDTVEKFLLLSHSHDGTLAVRVGFTPIRVVCANTLAMAHAAQTSSLIRLKHTSNVKVNLEGVREIMNLANQQFEATAEQYRLLARKSINHADLRKYVRTVLKVEEDAKVSTRMSNIIARCMYLAECGAGNNLASVRGTYWTAYNGINEYLATEKGNSADNRLNSLWFGDGFNVNKLALETALAMAA